MCVVHSINSGTLDGMVMVNFEASTLELEEGQGETVCIDATNDFERDIVVNVLSVQGSAEGWFLRPLNALLI